ncbi:MULTISPECIES: hypothetical protein [Thalassospira]|uniref:Glycine zipper domain-containing protein n=1 Tax=Thalassospira aquimaris TaxID=3037796 RepID=A0ABT6GBJ4_9PROT|nr:MULTISPECIES: hypothetical protein [Thalassospira]MDG4719252.1 hypothetical protein [Thalassospira sp. FZY0004]
MRSVLVRPVVIVTALGLSVATLAGCTGKTGEYAGQGAGIGAISGAIGGFVTAAIFGGNPVEAAAKSAVYGGAAGATAGAISGASADTAERDAYEAAQKEKRDRIRAKIGDDAFNGLAALAKCDHASARANADLAQKSSNADFALAGLWLEALAYSDQGQESSARAMYGDIIARDPKISDETAAELRRRELADGLSEIRGEYDLPKVCPA